ncbi:MAG: hypothetical protein ACON38_01440 [Akkermansiaceae bacterium]
MPKIGSVTGLLLIAISLIGYFASGMASMTAFIPAGAGIPILIGSIIARNPAKLKTGMHIAAVFGVIGTIAPLGRLIPTIIKGKFELNVATFSVISMLIICGAFTVLCIKSFKEARKSAA